jgi:hypothetical protein
LKSFAVNWLVFPGWPNAPPTALPGSPGTLRIPGRYRMV